MKKFSFSIFKQEVSQLGERIYKYRYYIAIVIFILCVVFEISGSSIGMWKNYIQIEGLSDNVIFGTSRGVRSDEWAVLTPMTFSQQFDGFKYFSNIVRGGNTDVFILYGLPVLNIVQIFKPFQLGFLFLGVSKGLSFFWCGRFIALFMISFEFAMIFTKKKKSLSIIYAFLITLSPIIQWWFAVNGIAELFIFGQLALILLYKYLNNNNFLKRCLYLSGLVISAGGYILIMYPAWQVSMFYVFLALAIGMILKNKKECKINKKDIISIILALIILGLSMGYILSQSMDTVKIVMNTVYPGARAEVGGNGINRYYQYVMNIFLPTKDIGLTSNTCEESTMFSLFPAGILLTGIVIFKEKKKDVYLIVLIVAYIFLGIWTICGFPSIIAKITLMSNSPVTRSAIAIGTLEILLLVRSLSIIEKPLKRTISIVISIALALILAICCKNFYPTYITSLKMMAAMVIMSTYLFYFIFRYQAKYAKIFLTFGIIFVTCMSGFMVNPIRQGTDTIYDSEIIQNVQKINTEKNGKWITEGMGFPYSNYILMAGVSTINCTNTYPNLDLWGQFGNEKYADIYNRYAHIQINIVNLESDYKDKFVLTAPDSFKVYILPSELQKLNVNYIFTLNNLENDNTKEVEFIKLYSYNEYKIYEVNYLND